MVLTKMSFTNRNENKNKKIMKNERIIIISTKKVMIIRNGV